MTLGQKLKKLRAEKDLTQKDLADQLHVSFQTVSKWENDENEPDIATLKELAKLYGCSIDYLVNEDDSIPEQEVEEKKEEPSEPVTKTIIIHQKELHVCERCKKDIPENDLEVGRVMTRSGGRGHSAEYRPAYYHKGCYRQMVAENEATARRIKAEKASRAKKLSFGWGIAGAVVTLGIALAIFLALPYFKENLHPGLAVLFSVIASYAIFADLYCIISGSYIGEVFVWAASLSIKFPGLIFSWDLGGFMWLIGMKILFAILGFLIGVAAFAFAIGLTAVLSVVSFPFALIHNINTDYGDSITD